MWALGKVPKQLILMTYREFCNHTGNVQHASYQQGYHAGLQSKWRAAKKTPAIIDDPIANLLSAVGDNVVIPQRAV